MTNQPTPAPRSKRILSGVLTAIVVIAILTAVINSNRKPTVIEAKVIAAVRADFPTFCTDGKILIELGNNNTWGIRCDTWLRMGFYGDVILIDVDNCTTIRPLFSMMGEYANQFEAINKTNGQKLAVCP